METLGRWAGAGTSSNIVGLGKKVHKTPRVDDSNRAARARDGVGSEVFAGSWVPAKHGLDFTCRRPGDSHAERSHRALTRAVAASTRVLRRNNGFYSYNRLMCKRKRHGVTIALNTTILSTTRMKFFFSTAISTTAVYCRGHISPV